MSARLDSGKKALILSLLAEGTAINAVCRVLKVGKNQVLDLILDAGAAAKQYHEMHVRNLTSKMVEADEVWSYIGQHERLLPTGYDKAVEGWQGDHWLFSATDADSKFVVAWAEGMERDEDTVTRLFDGVLRAVPGEFQLNTDGYNTFRRLMRSLPDRVHCAAEIKLFGPATEPSCTRKVTRLLGCTRQNIKGSPDMDRATTTHQERLHLTFRQQMRRFGRRTIGYSKKHEFHSASIALFIFIYNWCRKSESVVIKGKTPAMAMGLASKPFSLEFLVKLTDEYVKDRENQAFERAFKLKYGI
ncbi:MAG TPA: hypothetical protein VG796_25950 [Verrucomicrobiales bacterium]|nr:hypothetical protein [Verrucomicrobiales bacterium]